MLFAGQRFPLGVESTRIPEGVEEAINFDPKFPEQPEQEDIPSMFPPGSKQEELELGALEELKKRFRIKKRSRTYANIYNLFSCR